MKSFEEIAGIWLQSELFGKQYSYRKGLEKDVEHLIKYFGSRNCEEIKGMDVDKFIQYETEHVNPNHSILPYFFLSINSGKGAHSNVQITLDIYTHLEQKYRTIDISPFNNYVRNDVANLVIPMSNMA